MVKTYRLATLFPDVADDRRKSYAVTKKVFGPMMTLREAQHWQAELSLANKSVVIVNVETLQ